jgi:hypothetical protein
MILVRDTRAPNARKGLHSTGLIVFVEAMIDPV